jgi:hypothetical protein
MTDRAKPLLPWIKETLPAQIDGACRALDEEPSYEDALVKLSAHLLAHADHAQLVALAAAALLALAGAEQPMTQAEEEANQMQHNSNPPRDPEDRLIPLADRVAAHTAAGWDNECDHCHRRVSRDINGWWVGDDGTSDCDTSHRGHEVNGQGG